MAIQCPGCDHRLLEVAPKLFQCPMCGSGSSTLGEFPTIAFTDIVPDRRGEIVSATAISYEKGVYFIAPVAWEILSGSRRGSLIWLEPPVQIPEEEEEDLPLPVVLRVDPHTRRPGTGIQRGMFRSAEGVKIVDL